MNGTRDGFRLLADRFTWPQDTSVLDSETKHYVTICNLFLNEKLHLSDIVRLLDEDRGRVVLALLELGIIKERRTTPRPTQGPQKRAERR
jgi:hypothetical protein